jgi:hypothetical protein
MWSWGDPQAIPAQTALYDLERTGYVQSLGSVDHQLRPVEAQLTEKGLQVTSGWPTGEPGAAALLAAIATRIDETESLEERKGLQRAYDTLTNLGRDVLSEVLARSLSASSDYLPTTWRSDGVATPLVELPVKLVGLLEPRVSGFDVRFRPLIKRVCRRAELYDGFSSELSRLALRAEQQLDQRQASMSLVSSTNPLRDELDKPWRGARFSMLEQSRFSDGFCIPGGRASPEGRRSKTRRLRR